MLGAGAGGGGGGGPREELVRVIELSDWYGLSEGYADSGEVWYGWWACGWWCPMALWWCTALLAPDWCEGKKWDWWGAMAEGEDEAK